MMFESVVLDKSVYGFNTCETEPGRGSATELHNRIHAFNGEPPLAAATVSHLSEPG